MYNYDDEIMLENYNPEVEAESYDYNPGLTEIVTSEVNPDASEACSLAADYRAEGMDASSALKQAWADVKGEDNPSFEPSPLLVVLGMAGAFIGIWRLVKKQWPWQSWSLGRRQIARPFRPMLAQPSFPEVSHSSVQPVYQTRCEETVALILP